MDPGRGAGGQALRRHNLAVLLWLITSQPPESRAGLAAHTGLTKATVSALTAELIEAGLVHETGRRATDRPGRPATWLAPDPLGPVGLGLVLGEGYIDGHLVDLADSPVARETRKLAHGAEHALRLCRPVLRKLLDTATSAGRYVAGVTLAAAPSLAPQGLVTPLRQELAALGAHGIEVAAGEAVGFAAAAEPREPGEQRLLYLGGESELGARLSPCLGVEPRPDHAGTAHTGTGHAGTGHAGAPETEPYPFAHLPVRSRGLRCHCGARGCLECYTSRATIRAAPETATEALAAALRPALAVLGTHVVVLGGRADDLAAVVAFYEARNGRLYGFRFKDWSDYRSGWPSQVPDPGDQLIGIGDGDRTGFQLRKRYGTDEHHWWRTIRKPVSGSVRVSIDGVETSSGWSVDPATGVVTFDAAPADGAEVTAGFEFDVPVRFDSDSLEVTLDIERLGSITSIPLVELRIRGG